MVPQFAPPTSPGLKRVPAQSSWSEDAVTIGVEQDLANERDRRTDVASPQGSPSRGGPAGRQATGTRAANPRECAEAPTADKAGKLSPDDRPAQLHQARSLASCQQYTEAITQYRRVLESTPDDEAVLAELVDTMLRAHRNTEAIEASRELLRLNPENWNAQVLLARALAATGNYSEALQHYDNALRSEPDDYDALDGKGHVLYWTRRYSDARQVFQRLVQLNPDDTHAQEALREVEHAEEQAKWETLRPAPAAPAERLVSYYQQRLSVYPHERAAMKALAYNRARMRDLEGAIRDYRKVLANYPDDRDSKLELARTSAA